MTTAKESKRILSVTIKREVDTDPDTSWLGEYSDEPKQYAIVARGEHADEFADSLPCECSHSEDDHNDNGQCMENCDCEDFDRVTVERGRTYRYFNPVAENYTGSGTEAEIEKYCLQDYERIRTLNDGQWCFLGVSAVAGIQLANAHAIQRIRSGGLWGIESDSDDAYFREIEGEQLSELKDELHAIGFSKRAIVAAFRKVEHKDA